MQSRENKRVIGSIAQSIFAVRPSASRPFALSDGPSPRGTQPDPPKNLALSRTPQSLGPGANLEAVQSEPTPE